jgi:hypothetical protein
MFLSSCLCCFQLDNGPENNREGHREVVNRSANAIVAEERRKLESTEDEDQRRGPNTQDGTEQRSGQIVVILFILVAFMGRMVGVKIAQDTSITERVTNGVHHKDRHNQQGKNFIGETGSKTDDACYIEESGQQGVNENPDTNPSVESQVRNVHVLGHVVQDSSKGQNGSGRSDDTLFNLKGKANTR